MTVTTKKIGWASAMKQFFGFRPGTGTGEFMAELKALSYAEKMEFHAMLCAAGIDCEAPKQV